METKLALPLALNPSVEFIGSKHIYPCMYVHMNMKEINPTHACL